MSFLNTKQRVKEHAKEHIRQRVFGSNSSSGSSFVHDSMPIDARPWREELRVSSVTPYVALRGRLSQAWINRWTVLLFLVLVRTLIAIAGLQKDINSARREALAACSGVEDMGSAMASMPHYLSQGVNEMTANGINHAVNGLMSMLDLSVTAVEEIVVFVINTLYGTYLCLITLAVSGSLHAAIDLIEQVQDWLSGAAGHIGDDISSSVSDFTKALNSAIGDANNLFGNSIDIPTLNINSQINQLNNLKVPSDLDDNLTKLNNSIPNFDAVKDFVDNVIRLPFEEIKKLMGEAAPNYSFDKSVFPVPAKHKLTFCTDNNDINNFFNELLDLSRTGRKIAIGVLVTLALLVIIPMAWREIRRWRVMEERSKLVGQNHADGLDVVYIVSRPYTANAGIKLSTRVGSNRRRALIRWVIAYATTPQALFVLSLGIAGLFSALCQYVLLKAVQKEVPKLVNEVGEFAGKVVNALNNASESWANSTNDEILKINKDINNDLFGWVNTSTTALNDTLNSFVEKTTDVLNDTFGGTILYEPIQGVFDCLIGLKIEGIEKALTWVHDNAHIDFPLLPNNTFSLGAAASISGDNSQVSSFLADPSTGTTDQITGAVYRVTNSLLETILTETWISTALVALWVLVVLIGIARALTMAFGKEIPDSGADRLVDSSAAHNGEYTQEKGFTPAPPSDPNPLPTYYPRPSTDGTESNTANQYKGTSYTLKPRPFPKFGSASGESAHQPTRLSPVQENFGQVESKNIGGVTRKPSHVRVSSHGRIDETSPVSPNSSGANRMDSFDKMGFL